MTLSPQFIMIATIIELAICALGLYEGCVKKKTWGYLLAMILLLFVLFDVLHKSDISADILAILNAIAVFAGLGGMYLLVQEK